MADRERPIVEHLPFGGHRMDVEATQIVSPAAFVRLAGAAQLIVGGGALTAAAPFGVRCQQPIGEGALLAAHHRVFFGLVLRGGWVVCGVGRGLGVVCRKINKEKRTNHKHKISQNHKSP